MLRKDDVVIAMTVPATLLHCSFTVPSLLPIMTSLSHVQAYHQREIGQFSSAAGSAVRRGSGRLSDGLIHQDLSKAVQTSSKRLG